ncbi:unnamed protein product [Ostreobium quekettii]|uniref:Ribosomal protein L21 n=1 Tax=Ostreobium quekettii TaxID=121088 RepID=A0A8S1IVM5_9CHLO|nr:unnamed protein product [Ostreobium quekettii]|eukprot:evm.model.scf_841EXC.5 EVM.evm.TU.scf_841EXC.5   scf_841EXC:40257-42493(-)
MGKRHCTRDLFSKRHRKHGVPKLSTYLRTYRLGEHVMIKVDPSIQKGMPHKFYHGKTGLVWNITKRAVGVEVNKQVGNRIIKKRIHVRIEHVRHSKCRQDFLNRVKENERLKKEAKAKGEPIPHLKRQIAGPREGFTVSGGDVVLETVAPIPYDIVKEGVIN